MLRTFRLRLDPVALLLVAALGLACSPIGPIPGGRLRGDAGPDNVADWAFASDQKRLQLETRSSDPHSVNTWFVGIGPRLYVPTSMILGPKDPSERSWVSHVQEDPDVRFRIDGMVYERRMVRVEDEAEYAQAREALEEKYDLDPTDRDPERTVWIFRMEPRD